MGEKSPDRLKQLLNEDFGKFAVHCANGRETESKLVKKPRHFIGKHITKDNMRKKTKQGKILESQGNVEVLEKMKMLRRSKRRLRDAIEAWKKTTASKGQHHFRI